MLSSIPLGRIAKRYLTTSSHPLRICIVGSGPGGFYTAQKLLRSHPNTNIDVIDRLPVPFGLVRFGVAPDHPEVKNVINTFNKVAESGKVQYLGNVEVGRDVKLEDLRKRYAAVVLAYGADQDRTLNIPGEDLPGVLSARSFVGWYNGHPDHCNLQPDLTAGDTAIVIGQGNVALDCARILLSPPSRLENTDITEYALEALRKSTIRRVFCVGRRGPLQAAFTIKEFREMTRIPDTRVVLRDSDIALAQSQLPQVKDRARKRITELMLNTHKEGNNVGAQKEFHLVFCRSPMRVVEKDGRAGGVAFQVTSLDGPWDKAKALPTDQTETIDGALVLRSVGYKSTPLKGAPFDPTKHLVPNMGGRVKDDGGEAPLYCAGWVKRGPTGVILSTMNDAYETAEVIAQDITDGKIQAKPPIPGEPEDTSDWLRSRGVVVVSFDDWKRIESEEIRIGLERGKLQEKMTDIDAMLALLGSRAI